MSSPVALRAQALHRLLELTECRCGYTLGMHATHCFAEYREDVEVLVPPQPRSDADSRA